MKIEIHNTYAEFRLENDEPPKALIDLRNYFTQNDTLRKFKMVFKAEHGRVPDLKKQEDLEKYAYFAESPNLSNYLCMVYNKRYNPGQNPYYNFVHRYRFHEDDTWNGKSSVLNFYGRKIRVPIGYLRPVMKRMYHFFKENEIPLYFDLDDKRINLVHGDLSIEPVYEVGDLELYDYQKRVVDLLRSKLMNTKKNGHLFSCFLLDLAVNFGKSITISSILKNFPSCSAISWQADQVLFMKQIAEWVEAGFDVGFIGASTVTEKKVQKYLDQKGIKGSAHKGWRQHTVAMVQTVSRRLKSKDTRAEYTQALQEYQIGVFDEIDWLVRPTFDEILQACRFGMQLGLSGTPYASFEAKGRHRVRAIAGGATIRVTHADMVRLGKSLPLEYRVIPMEKDGFLEFRVMTNKDVREEYIFFSAEWQAKIMAILDLHPDSQTMIYMGSMEISYIEEVYKSLKDKGYDVGMTHGKDKERFDKQLAFEKGEGPKIMLVNSIWGTGINIPNLEVMIYGSLSDSEREFIQAITGRIARKGDLEKAYIYDFYYMGFGKYTTNSLIRQHYASRSDIALDVINPFQL